jgi:hypothetical protein
VRVEDEARDGKTRMKSFALGIVLAAMAATAGVAAPAPANPLIPPDVSSPLPKQARATPHALVTTFTDTAFPKIILAAGFDNIDKPTTITCASKDGCNILISAMVTVTSTTDGNNWAICPTVDGEFVPDICHFQGITNFADLTKVGNVQGQCPIARGKHQVQVQVYAPGGINLVSYNTRYDIMTP